MTIIKTRGRFGRCVAWRGWVARLSLLLLAAPLLFATAVEELPLKAAFLYNFARFVSWPGTATGPETSLVLAVYGRDPFVEVLDETVRGKTIGGRHLVVRRARSLDDVLPCDILFIGTAESRRTAEALRAVRGVPVLTVGEGQEFLPLGGIITFVIEERRVRFEINTAAARRAGLRISSRLLNLARAVVE